MMRQYNERMAAELNTTSGAGATPAAAKREAFATAAKGFAGFAAGGLLASAFVGSIPVTAIGAVVGLAAGLFSKRLDRSPKHD
jgi:hypothetical protein